MALIKTGGGVASISGSVNGTTFSHNRGGPYMRGRAVPTNPSTSRQQAVRNAMAELATAWVETLTAAQRNAWALYAENVPLVGPLGDPRNVGGIGMYCRSNVPRLQAGLPRVDSGPTTFDLGTATTPTIDAINAGSTVDIAFDNGDDWANEDDSSLLCYVGPPQNVSINFFKGPYQFMGSIDGDATTPPTSPASLAPPVYDFTAGQKGFVQIRVSRADGRLSSPFRLSGIAA